VHNVIVHNVIHNELIISLQVKMMDESEYMYEVELIALLRGGDVPGEGANVWSRLLQRDAVLRTDTVRLHLNTRFAAC